MKKRILIFGIGLVLFTPNWAHADFEAPSPRQLVADTDVKARIWDLAARAFVGHDSNTAFVPDITTYNGTKGSAVYGMQLKGAIRFLQKQNWTAGFLGSFDLVRYTKAKGPGQTDAPNEYNLTAVNPGLFVRRNFDLGTMPGSVGASYDYRREDWAIVTGRNDSHNVNLDANVSVRPNTQVGVNFGYGMDDFKVIFPNSSLNDRDADRYAVGAFIRYWLLPGITSAKASYTYGVNDAKGSNFDYDGHALEGRLESRIVGPFWGAVAYSKDWRDYDGFTSGSIPAPGRKEQDIDKISVRFLWTITQHWIADVYFRRTLYDSNQGEFRSDRTQYGVGLSYKF